MEGSTGENWNILKHCIMESAEKCVECARRKQPDWFVNATDVVIPLLDAKEKAHCRYLQTQHSSAKKEFRRHQKIVKQAVDEAKEAWINSLIAETERGRDGKLQWECIKKLQLAFSGRRPARSIRLHKRDGELTAKPEELRKRILFYI